MKKRYISSFIILITGLLFTSCNSVLSIDLTDGKLNLSYTTSAGPQFIKTASAFETFNEDEPFFNTTEVIENFNKAGFENVLAVTPDKNGITVFFSQAKDKSDSLSKTGILKAEHNEIKLTISKNQLQLLYEELPIELKSYIDLFMAPSFTGEEISDEEYLDLVASVYGQTLADEIQSAKIKFVFSKNSKQVLERTLSLTKIINLIGKLELKA